MTEIPAHLKNNPSKVWMRVSNVEQMGSETLVYGDLNVETDVIGESPTRIILKAESGTSLTPGDIIDVAFNTAKLHIFDAETEKTLVPHMVEYNDILCEVCGGKLFFLGQQIDLPPAIDCPDGKGHMTVPSDAIRIELGGIPAKVVGCEEINGNYLVAIDVNDKRIYAACKKPVEEGETGINIDIKRVAFEIGAHHVPALQTQSELVAKLLIGRYDEASNSVKHAGKGNSICYLSIEGAISPVPEDIGNKITANYTRREALKHSYKIVFSPDAVRISDEGMAGHVENILDYGTEKFAVIKVGESTITAAVDAPVAGDVHISLDYSNVGVIDMKNDVKLV